MATQVTRRLSTATGKPANVTGTPGKPARAVKDAFAPVKWSRMQSPRSCAPTCWRRSRQADVPRMQRCSTAELLKLSTR